MTANVSGRLLDRKCTRVPAATADHLLRGSLCTPPPRHPVISTFGRRPNCRLSFPPSEKLNLPHRFVPFGVGSSTAACSSWIFTQTLALILSPAGSDWCLSELHCLPSTVITIFPQCLTGSNWWVAIWFHPTRLFSGQQFQQFLD